MAARSRFLAITVFQLVIAVLYLSLTSQHTCATKASAISEFSFKPSIPHVSMIEDRRLRNCQNIHSEDVSFITERFQTQSITTHHLRSKKSKTAKLVPIRGGSSISMPSKESSVEGKDDSNSSNRDLVVFLSSSFVFTFSLALTAFASVPALVAEIGSERTTSTLAIIGALTSLAQIVVSPAMGGLLDSIGRKPALLFYTFCLLSVHGIVSIHSSVLTICTSKFVAGLCTRSMTTVSQVVISDLAASDPQRMSSLLGLQSALNGLGFLLGAVSGGWATEMGLSITYGASAVISLLSAIIVVFGVRETLSQSKRISFHENKTKLKRQLLKSPISSCTRILFSHSKDIRVLAILLMIQSFPLHLGTTYQVLVKSEWNVGTKGFSSFFAMISFISIIANIVGSQLVVKLGIKYYTLICTLSSMLIPLGALFSFRGHVTGCLIGLMGFAQSLGVNAALYAAGEKSNISKGKLAGETSSFLALTGVIGPLFYSMLYVNGKKIFGLGLFPFIFNIALGLVSFSISQRYLSS